MSIYNLPDLEKTLQAHETKLLYSPTMISTIDVAIDQPVGRMVILTDHQSNGRGRYGRVWQDDSGCDLIVTFIKPMATSLVPPVGSLLLSHLFALAILNALNKPGIKICWPNDLFFDDKKLGGILVSLGNKDHERQNILFSVGINLKPKNDFKFKAISLAEIDCKNSPNDLIEKINNCLDEFLLDLSRFNIEKVRQKYERLWLQASALIGRKIQISGNYRSTVGVVTESPLGEALALKDDEGSIMKIKEYGRSAHIKLL